MRARQFVPPLFVVALLASLGAALMSAAPWWVFVGVAGMYMVLNLAASVSASDGHAPTALLLPVVFVILHVSYGCGFLKGLVAFSNRWRGTTPSAHHHVPDAGPFFS
jgi:hypothetical protein